MAEPHSLSNTAHKARLIAELAQARSAMSGSFRDTQGHLDQARSAAGHQALWLTGAAAGGWLLGKLTGRKSRKSKKEARSAIPVQQIERSGWLLALLGTVGTLLRPAITSYVTHRLSDYLSRGASDDFHVPPPPKSSSFRR